MSTQQAAVLVAKGEDFQVQTIEKHKPGKGEILVRNHAIATNPFDGAVQKLGIFVKDWSVVTGCDIAGTVEEVGEGVTRWKVGDRVYAFCFENPLGLRKGGFQEYTIVRENYAGEIPDNFSFEQAAAFVIPITAASSFYCDAKLPFPSHKRPTLSNDSPVCYVNSGSSGVGSAAIQLALLHGYRVIATSSPKNFDLVKSFGASEVFDYKDPELAQKVKNAAGKKIGLAYDAAGQDPNSLKTCVDILDGKGTLLTVVPNPVPIDWKEVIVHGAYCTRLLEDERTNNWWWKFAKAAAEEGTLKTLKPEIMGHSIADVGKVVAFHASGNVSGIKPVIKLI